MLQRWCQRLWRRPRSPGLARLDIGPARLFPGRRATNNAVSDVAAGLRTEASAADAAGNANASHMRAREDAHAAVGDSAAMHNVDAFEAAHAAGVDNEALPDDGQFHLEENANDRDMSLSQAGGGEGRSDDSSEHGSVECRAQLRFLLQGHPSLTYIRVTHAN